MPVAMTAHLWDAIHAEAANGGGWRAVSARLAAAGVRASANTVGRYLASPRPGGGGEPLPRAAGEPVEGFRENVEAGTAELVVRTDRIVRTYEDAVRAAEVDLTVWEVRDWEAKTWTVPMRVRQGQHPETKAHLADRPIQTQQYGVRLRLKRIYAKPLSDALDIVYERFRDAAPRWPDVRKVAPAAGEPCMAVYGLFDVHFGKLCWAAETGENYDLKIAEATLRNGVADIVARTRHRNVTKILFPLGNDWFHVDTRTHTTTKGTPQDVDGRFSKVLATGKLAALWAVEQMAAVAPVQVELVPGNHDRTLAECLAHVIDARFHHTDRVAVNASPQTRKYVRFGCNLIGLTHGDLVKPDRLPGLMPVEAKRDWAETTTHEWITGHGHRSQKWTTLDTDTQQGTVVRQLRALTRTDLWHYDHGFCGQVPACEAYFYGFESGYSGHEVAPARVA